MLVGKSGATLPPHSQELSILYFETGSLIGLELTDLARLDIHGATGFLLSLSLSPAPGIQAHNMAFSPGFWGSNFLFMLVWQVSC